MPMADYYTYVSFTIPLAPDRHAWAIAELIRTEPTDENEETEPTCVICEADRDVIWIHDDGGAVNLDELAIRLQSIMRHFNIPGKWGFEWSCDCSKPRTDAYGGGA